MPKASNVADGNGPTVIEAAVRENAREERCQTQKELCRIAECFTDKVYGRELREKSGLHADRNRRDDNDVAEPGERRKRLEMMNEERRCGKRCAKRDVRGVDHEGLNLLPNLVAAQAFGQVLCRVVWSPDDDACGGGKRKLKARIPNDVRLREYNQQESDA